MLNWNGWRDTIACLESIRRQDYPCYETVVVDNGSSDESVARIKAWAQGQPIRLIESAVNLGFAGGCNLGVAQALAVGASHVFLLNNDARAAPDCLTHLVDVAARADAAIVGARILDERGGRTLFNGHRWPLRLFVGGRLRRTDPARSFWPSSDASGAAMLLRRDLLERRVREAGHVLDPGLFLYWEDADLCRWAIARGYRCVVARDATVTHALAKSSGGRENARSLYYTTRNRIAMANRWLSLPWKAAFHVYYLPSRLAIQALRPNRWRTGAAAAVIAGLWDGYRGVSGAWGRHGGPAAALYPGTPIPR